MIAERYVLLEQIGAGGFATTYRGQDRVLDRPVAIKMLRPEHAADPDFVSRFEQEAQAAAAISHPNVVQVYDVARSANLPVIVLEYIAGRDLRRVLREEGPMSPETAAGLIRQALAGLAAVHRAGIVHRDIKPENILLGNDGIVRLTDFGIAHFSGGLTLTHPGTAFGTVGYTAPEQALGRPVSPATDLYAMGVVLFELLTGRLPFEAENPVVLMLAHVEQTAPLPSAVRPGAGISPALDAVVARALAKDAADRFPDAPAMAAALAAALSDETMPVGAVTQPLIPVETSALSPTPAATRPTIDPPTRKPSTARRPIWQIPLLLLIVAGLGLAGVAAKRLHDSSGGRPPTIPAVARDYTPATTVPDPTHTVTSVPAIVPVLTATMAPSQTPVPTATAIAIPTQTPMPTATATPSPIPTQTPVPTATSTATATATAEPTPTDTPPPPTNPIAPINGDNAPPIVPVTTRQASALLIAATQPRAMSPPAQPNGHGNGHDKSKPKDHGNGHGNGNSQGNNGKHKGQGK